MSSKRTQTITMLLALAAMAHTAPVKTVPWNGHKGAVTFTFDDGCASQITNVLPALKTRGLNATFFLIGNSAFTDKLSAWKQAALDGNELGNHTTLHDDLSTLDSAKIATEIFGQAAALRAVDPAVEAVTLAYPYCGTNKLVDRITNRENIIARTCGGTAQFSWTTKPTEWMEMTSMILQDDASAADALTEIDNAAKNNSWLVTLDHGVGGDWMQITTAQAEAMFDRAIAAKVWVSTYQNVAAYWRASKTMDTVSAKVATGGWNLKWVSPHPRMPRSVKLRIKLDTSIFGSSPKVSQDGAPIARETDSSYVIDFMKLAMDVSNANSGIADGSRGSASRAVVGARGDKFWIRGLPKGSYEYVVRDAAGARTASGSSVATEDGEANVASSGSTGRILELRGPVSMRLLLPAIR